MHSRYSQIAQLFELLTGPGENPVNWTEKQQKAFEELRLAITSTPRLAGLPDLTKPFTSYVTGKDKTAMGVLTQTLGTLQYSCLDCKAVLEEVYARRQTSETSFKSPDRLCILMAPACKARTATVRLGCSHREDCCRGRLLTTPALVSPASRVMGLSPGTAIVKGKRVNVYRLPISFPYAHVPWGRCTGKGGLLTPMERTLRIRGRF